MGFGALFLGIMFLYDFQLGLRHEGAELAYAVLDIFPDVIGWILLFFGTRSLSKKEKSLDKVVSFPLLMFFVSLFTLAKDTLLYGFFYSENQQGLLGEGIDFTVHLAELAFLLYLFRAASEACRKSGEDKLSRSHLNVRGLISAEAFLFVLARTARLLPLPESLVPAVNVISALDFVFTVSFIWYGAVTLFRSMVRVSD